MTTKARTMAGVVKPVTLWEAMPSPRGEDGTGGPPKGRRRKESQGEADGGGGDGEVRGDGEVGGKGDGGRGARAGGAVRCGAWLIFWGGADGMVTGRSLRNSTMKARLIAARLIAAPFERAAWWRGDRSVTPL